MVRYYLESFHEIFQHQPEHEENNLAVQDFLAMEIMFSMCLCVFFDEGRHQSQDRPRPLPLFGALGILKKKFRNQLTYIMCFL